MLYDFRIFVFSLIIVIKLCGQVTTAAWKPPKKLDLNNWKKEKVKDFDFHCQLDLTSDQKNWLYEPESSFDEATGALDVPKQTNFRGKAFDVFHWPKRKDGYVHVPYLIQRGAKFSSNNLRLIRDAMDGIEKETCIRFRPREVEEDFLNISHGKFCKSNLGRTGGAQALLLNKKDCFEEGIIMHELLHALGYVHTHSRPDRDKFVKVLWKNIDPKFRREFNQVSRVLFNNYGTQYDYFSVMHYGPKAFSRNGDYTIATKDSSYQSVIGQRRGLSDGDIQRINTKYKCKESSWRIRLLSKWRDDLYL